MRQQIFESLFLVSYGLLVSELANVSAQIVGSRSSRLKCESGNSEYET